MQKFQYMLEAVGVSIILTYLVICTIKLKRMSNEIESLRFEQDKTNFRLFIAEKAQKIIQDKKIS